MNSAMTASRDTLLSFDIGGTHLRVGRGTFDAGSGEYRLLEHYVFDTPSDGTQGAAMLIEKLRGIAAGVLPAGIGGGVAGYIEDGTVVQWSNRSGWNGLALRQELERAFPESRIVVENDAAVAAVGEAKTGAGAGGRVVAYLTIGTGIGGARCVNGALDVHASGFEPGGQVIDADTGETLEAVASGAAICRRFGKDLGELNDADFKEIIRMLAAGVHNCVLVWSPDIFILGGAVPATTPALIPALEKALADFPAIVPMPPLVPAMHGEMSGLIGGLVFARRA